MYLYGILSSRPANLQPSFLQTFIARSLFLESVVVRDWAPCNADVLSPLQLTESQHEDKTLYAQHNQQFFRFFFRRFLGRPPGPLERRVSPVEVEPVWSGPREDPLPPPPCISSLNCRSPAPSQKPPRSPPHYQEGLVNFSCLL